MDTYLRFLQTFFFGCPVLACFRKHAIKAFTLDKLSSKPKISQLTTYFRAITPLIYNMILFCSLLEFLLNYMHQHDHTRRRPTYFSKPHRERRSRNRSQWDENHVNGGRAGNSRADGLLNTWIHPLLGTHDVLRRPHNAGKVPL
jgi:hypothetical protein